MIKQRFPQLSIVALLALCGTATGSLAQDAEWLKEQRKFLDKSEEPAVYIGAKACATNGAPKRWSCCLSC